MKKFEKITAPIECDVYEISTRNGERYLRVWGYFYKGDGWQMVDMSKSEGPLKQFVDGVQRCGLDFVWEFYEGTQQWQNDVSADDVVKAINGYFDGWSPDAYLSFDEVTMATADGTYVNLIP